MSAGAPAVSAARTPRSSTTTAGGTPLVEIVTAPDIRSADEAQALPPAPAADHRRAGHLRCGDGEGHAARRRQRLRPPDRLGRAAHAHRDQEHELLQLHRPWNRGGGRAADRRLGVRWRGGATDLRLRRRDGHSHRAALEGGGRRLPLLPGAGPRAGRACDRARGGSACRASRVTGGSHPPHRACTRSRARDRARHGRSRPSLGRDRRRGRRRRRLGERDREQPRRGGCRSSGCARRPSSRSS